jgi:hypothetical protein
VASVLDRYDGRWPRWPERTARRWPWIDADDRSAAAKMRAHTGHAVASMGAMGDDLSVEVGEIGRPNGVALTHHVMVTATYQAVEKRYTINPGARAP